MALELVPMDLQILIVILVALQWAVLARYAHQRLFYYFWAWGWLCLAILLGVARIKATDLATPGALDFLLVLYSVAAVLQVFFLAVGSWLLVPGRRVGIWLLTLGLLGASFVGLSVGYLSLKVGGEEGIAIRFALRALFLTAIYFWTGWMLFRSRRETVDIGQILTSAALLLLAAHFGYYVVLTVSDLAGFVSGRPLLAAGVSSINRPVHFVIDVTLILVIAIGSVLMIVRQLVSTGSSAMAARGSFPHPGCRIGNIQVDLVRRTVSLREKEVPLPDLSFRLLGALIRSAPNTVRQDDLVEETWGTLAVSDETLKQRVWLLRKSLEDKHGDLIKTDRGRGYRLAEVPIFVSDDMHSEFRRYAATTSLIIVVVLVVAMLLSGLLLLS